MPLNDKFKKKLISILRKFKLNEFKVVLALAFPSIKLKQVHQYLDKLKLPLTSRCLTEIIVGLYEKNSPSKDDCDQTLCQIFLLDASCHNSYAWVASKLRNEVSDIPGKLNDLNNAISRSYRSKALNANVHSVLYNDIIWSVIVERILLKKGGIKLGPPHFFAFKPNLEDLHVLFSPRTMDRDLHLQIYIESLGYNDYELLDYDGHSPVSMMDCIQKQYSVDREIVPFSNFKPGAVMRMGSVGEGWQDYSQAVDRKSYAGIFTNSVNKHITVECDRLCVTESADCSRSSSLTEFYSTMEFVAKGANSSVEEIFEHLVTVGAVHFPLPHYMLNIGSTPSNVLTVQQ